MRAAPWRERDGSDPQGLPLLCQRGPESHVPRLRSGATTELAQDFRTYFIAIATNTYSTMHYDTFRPHYPEPLHELHAALQDASRRPPPSGVKQRDHLLLGCREVDRDAIGDGDREQQPACAGGMPVHAVDDQPSVAARGMPQHGRAVHLVR